MVVVEQVAAGGNGSAPRWWWRWSWCQQLITWIHQLNYAGGGGGRIVASKDWTQVELVVEEVVDLSVAGAGTANTGGGGGGGESPGHNGGSWRFRNSSNKIQISIVDLKYKNKYKEKHYGTFCKTRSKQ